MNWALPMSSISLATTTYYHNKPRIMDQFCLLSINKTLATQYMQVMSLSYPIHLNATTTMANFLLCWWKRNLPSISLLLNKVMVTMKKGRTEQLRPSHPTLSLSVCTALLHHATAYHCQIGQKDCQIFDASCKYNWDSIPVNSLTSTPYSLKLHCKFGSVRDPHLCV